MQNNTEWVARALARFAQLPASAVSYAGLKDRQAVTEQWFSVHLPGKSGPDWSQLGIDGIDIMTVARHSRKLKRGALRGNRFQILIRAFQADRDAVDARLTEIRCSGIPNYFGRQRFGRDGQNLLSAEKLFTGVLGKLPRHKRGLYLSAARSALFNQVLSARVAASNWNRCLSGDVFQLEGKSACFLAEGNDPLLTERIEQLEIHPTGPMWGRGELMSARDCRAVELSQLDTFSTFRDGLERAGLKQERRSLRIRVADLDWQWQQADVLKVSFTLPAGAYATGVLREICHCE